MSASVDPTAASPLPPGFRWPHGIRAAAVFTYDLDAESAMLWDHPETAAHLDVMAHQAYGPRTAVPRLLRLLDRQAIRATFFIPGYTAEHWPAVARSIRDAGHEIAHHGYLHEGSRGADEATEEARLLRGLEALDTVLGVRPVGYRAPSWEMTWRLPSLLARHGFRYDAGLMDSDWPYRLAATGDPAGPTIVEIPTHWSLDDWGAYNHYPGLTGSGVIHSPSAVLERWTLELEALAAEGGLFDLTMHPFVSGRASRAVALEQLIARARSIDGMWVTTCAEVAAWVETLPLEPVVHRPVTLPDGGPHDPRATRG
jgi:peptidoglycan/xylan/chitin deacetylase (PgdA/CDA1 family)